MEPNDSNGWSQWSKHVIITLQNFDEKLEKIDDKLKQIEIDIAMLKFKSGFWGSIGAAVSIAAYYFINKFTN